MKPVQLTKKPIFNNHRPSHLESSQFVVNKLVDIEEEKIESSPVTNRFNQDRKSVPMFYKPS